MKRILTHRTPDLDAIVSAWLAQDFLFAGEAAEVIFVSRQLPLTVKQSADCLVDVGNAYEPLCLWFDHKPPAFENRNSTCATKLIWEYLCRIGQDVGHLEPLVQVTFEGDTHKSSPALKQSRIDGPHAELSHLAKAHNVDAVVYVRMVDWLRRRYAQKEPGAKIPEKEAERMSYQIVESKFVATEEKGEVSSLLMRPENARWLLVLGHGASTNMHHKTLQTIAERLADVGIATFRYNFPYAEAGGGRNSNAVCQETVRSAVAAARAAASGLSILVGGHSFSGRMSSMAAAEAPLESVCGLVFFVFPLHPSGKPSTERADHLHDVTIPMLFLSGTRDKLAELELLQSVCETLADGATLHLLDTADHGFKVLKRSRKTDEDVFVEMARVLNEWANRLD